MNQLLLCTAVLTATTAATAQICQSQRLVTSDPQTASRFGIDAAMSTDALVVGANQADLNLNGPGFRGGLYVWRHSMGTWNFEAKIDGFANPSSYLGRGVAIDGDTIAATALSTAYPYERAEVFRRVAGAWTHEQALVPSDPNSSASAQPLAIAVDGNRIAVGHHVAAGHPTVPIYRTGAVYVYERNGTWQQAAKLVPANAAYGDACGEALAMRGGVLAFSQRPANGPAAVHIYGFAGGIATLAATVTPTNPGATNYFGFAVATDGVRVAVTDIGDTELAGNQGAVHVYVQQGGTWVAEQVVRPAVPAGYAQLGREVAIDGDQLLVSGGNPHRIWRFRRHNGVWEQPSSPDTLPAAASAVALRGSQAAIGMEQFSSSDGAVDTFFVGSRAASYGPGLAGTGAVVPTLLSPTCPVVGGPLVLDIDDGRGGAPALIGWSFTAGDTPLLGGRLLIGPLLTTQLVMLGGQSGVAGAGAFSVPVGVLAPALIGLRFFTQAGVFDPAAPQGVALTRGLEIVIG